jgi:hypothetical protein
VPEGDVRYTHGHLVDAGWADVINCRLVGLCLLSAKSHVKRTCYAWGGGVQHMVLLAQRG